MSALREAAQQALEALEQINSSLHLLDCYKAFDAKVAALKAALEQPEQDVPEADCGNMEPVAWWNPQYGTDSYAFSDEKSAEWRVPLFTRPPRRLTDEVIADLWHQNGTYHHHFARAIERWLKGQE